MLLPLFDQLLLLLTLFFTVMVSNASIILPVPFDLGFPLIVTQLPDIHPVLIGIVIGIGAAIGELTAYVVGFLGIKAVEKFKNKDFFKLDAISVKLKATGMVFIFFGALTPFPFDLIGLAAGLTRFDLKKFFLATLAGKIVRYVLIAVAAVAGYALLQGFFGLP
ncbi:MAG: VTT domain-containing protein [archaeon]